jgi:hypothetical protein
VELTFRHREFEIVIAEESPAIPRFREDSSDNAAGGARECFIEEEDYAPSSRSLITVRSGEEIVGSLVLLACGGATGVHARSAFLRAGICFVAIGPFVCALEIPSLKPLWHTRVDTATCFGIFNVESRGAIISHGELEVARLDYSGQVMWSVAGGDIFTGSFELFGDYAEVMDFEGTRYRVEVDSGRIKTVAV